MVSSLILNALDSPVVVTALFAFGKYILSFLIIKTRCRISHEISVFFPQEVITKYGLVIIPPFDSTIHLQFFFRSTHSANGGEYQSTVSPSVFTTGDVL